MAYNGYNVPMRRLLPKGLILLVAAAGLVTLSPAQGGVFPGSNGRIAYTCGPNICSINPDGTGKNPTFLTSASDPSWSSDQSLIAYVDPAAGISVANDDGSFPGPIGAASGSAQPSLSFDGSRVAYVRGGIIYTSQSFGGGELPLTTGGADADPAYSPDGTKIAFARNSGGASGFDIWTINVSTGVLHQVTNAVGDERSPTWSPSGLSIVYSAGIDAQALRRCVIDERNPHADRPERDGHRPRVLAGRNADRLCQHRRAILR